MNSELFKKEKNILILLIAACVLTYLIGWQIPLMEIDAVQYANISREMLLHKNFLHLYDQGRDYLDKPPMLFWLSSASMKIFGVNDAAYRLPSFLFSILSVYSTYRFSRLYYPERVALLSALVLAGSQAMFLINHDVRTDTMLMGWVIFGIWQLAAWLLKRRWTNLIMAAFAIGGGMMTKGPIALMVPVFAFSAHFLLTRSFKSFFRWEWVLLLFIIGILLIPMSIGLYQQYDVHPEKIMYGQKGISGLRFFYWTQSFGRITGESTWHENDSFFFLFENLLWGFLPWTIFFILGLATGILEWVSKKFLLRAGEEGISLGGFLITYCALASSKAQLPHYIYVVLPLGSVVTGKFIHRLFFESAYPRWVKPLSVIHWLVFSLLVIALFFLITLPFPPLRPMIVFSVLLMTGLFLLVLIRRWIPLPNLLTGCVLAIVLINTWLDFGFYRSLLQYQMSIPVSRFIMDNHLNKDKIFLYQMDPSRSLDFYSNHLFYVTNRPDSLQRRDFLLTSGKGMEMINRNDFKIIDSGIAFHVSSLSLPVLNPATRRSNSDAYYLLEHF
jgi:4-amino-4-deoxy-L-arabinose transferase-like glycosyltransferase